MPKPLGGRIVGAVFALVALYAVGFSLWQFTRFSSSTLLSDFRAFYCAAQLQSRGVDPYRQEPLYRCESAATAAVLWRASGNVTDPVPLPPYTIAAFVPLQRLPFAAAALVWTGILICGWAMVVIALRRVTGYSWTVLFACLFFAAMMSISLGQIAPLAIAAICLAALLLSLQQFSWAGAAVATAMIEPHVALPACIAVFVSVPRSRLPMLGVGLALLAISLTFGLGRNLEYAREVLPTHALSDVADVGQFSFTVLVHVLGFSDRIASHAGSIWYAVMSLAGIVTAVRLAKGSKSLPLVAVLPMAFAVFGGVYVHWQQVVAAIPAALLLLRGERNPYWPLAASLIALSIPWMYVVGWGFLIPGAAAISGVLAWRLLSPALLTEATIVLGVFCALLLCNHGLAHQVAQPAFRAAVTANQLADLSWGDYVRARIPIGNGLFFWLHLPTWVGLAGVVTVASRRAWRSVNSQQAG
jgi:hypothetical protein